MLFGSLILLMILGINIFIAMALSSFIIVLFFMDTSSLVLVQRFIGGIDKFVLMALPLFILAGNLMVEGGLSKRILNWCKTLIGHISGGMAMTTQAATTVFGALSGSSPATVAAIGKIMYPEMTEKKYPKSFTLGLITSSGSVALLIPPSMTMIVYGSTMGVSVGSLFMAGVTVGLLYALFFMIYIYFYAKKHRLPKSERMPFSAVWKETKATFWSLLAPVIVLGGIYSGIFTPTEAAGVAVLYSIIIGLFIYKEINLKDLFKVSMKSAIDSAQVMILVASCMVFLWALTILQIPQGLSMFLAENVTTAWAFLILLNLLLLILGMFLDPTPAVIIVAPLIAQTAYSLGIDPIHLGMIFVTNVTIGMFTPPFGLNLFVAQGISGASLGTVSRGVIPFLIVSLVALLTITYIPEISTVLPTFFAK